MTTVPSATTWGSPTASKHALLIHGLTSSSHTWHRVATPLAEKGYYVTAPNVAGHASRAAPDYSLRAIADDLRPYLDARAYDLVLGHSLGGILILHLLAYLPRTRPVAIVIVDAPFKVVQEDVDRWKGRYEDLCVNVESPEAHCAENPLWTREDGIYRALSRQLCPPTTPAGILAHNRPWLFVDLLKEVVSEKWKVSVLAGDPAIFTLCPRQDVDPRVRYVTVPGAGHWVQSECPDAIVKEVLERVAELNVSVLDA